MKKKKLKMKKSFKRLLFLVIIVGIIIFVPIHLNEANITQLTDINYSREASKAIISKGMMDDVLSLGFNEVLNDVIADDEYDAENYTLYLDLEYSNVDDLANNINLLNELDYKSVEISYILASGTNEEIKEFIKLGNQRDVDDFLKFEYSLVANYERYVDYKIKTRNSDYEVVLQVNLGLDKPHYENSVINDSFSETMLVNKYNGVSSEYEPVKLEMVPAEYGYDDRYEYYLSKGALNGFMSMSDAASEEGLSLLVGLGYRSYEEQQQIYDDTLLKYGEENVDKYAVRAGHSEHQTGLAVDIMTRSGVAFAGTDELEWLIDNAHLYGFIYRYPESGEDMTGYNNETRHFRYVGIETATFIKENNLVFDVYYMLYVD